MDILKAHDEACFKTGVNYNVNHTTVIDNYDHIHNLYLASKLKYLSEKEKNHDKKTK